MKITGILMKVIGILLIICGAYGVVALGIGLHEASEMIARITGIAILTVIAILGGVGFLTFKKIALLLSKLPRFAVDPLEGKGVWVVKIIGIFIKIIGILLIICGAFGVAELLLSDLDVYENETGEITGIAIFSVIAILGGVGLLTFKKFAPLLSKRPRFAVKLALGVITVIISFFTVSFVVFSIQDKYAFNEYYNMILPVAHPIKYIPGEIMVKQEFQGACGGIDEYADQSITVGKNSVSGALNINGIWTDEGGKYEYEEEGDQLHVFWAYIYKGNTRIGFFMSGTWASDDTTRLEIALGKRAIEYASMYKRDFTGIQIDTLGYDTTWNWIGTKKKSQ